MKKNNYNQYVIWVQAYDTSSNSLVVVDGEIIAPNDSRYTTLSQEAIHISKDFSIIYKDKGTTIYKSDNSPCIFLIISHFEEVDTVGRRIAYCCKVKSTSISEAIQYIRTEMSKFGYDVGTNLQIKKCLLPKLSRNHIISIFVIVIILVLLLLSIFKKTNHEQRIFTPEISSYSNSK